MYCILYFVFLVTLYCTLSLGLPCVATLISRDVTLIRVKRLKYAHKNAIKI